MDMKGIVRKMLEVAAGGLLLATLALPALAQTALQDIRFSALPGAQFEIRLDFNGAPPSPDAFMLEDPARLTLDLPNVRSELEERRYALNFNEADSVMILEAQGRTRMVVNLNRALPYTVRSQGNSLVVVVGAQDAAGAAAVPVAAQATGGGNAGFTPVGSSGADIVGVDFRRGDNDSGQIIINLARGNLSANVSQNGARLYVEFRNASVGRDSQVRLDVQDFATAVRSVSAYNDDGSAIIMAEIAGEYEYLAYQSNNQYIVNVMGAAAVTAQNSNPMAAYSGERIDLNFQNIEVRSVLQILADFNNFSLVVGDNVTGNMTLRLVDVPWDQALEMVLKPRGLGSRLVGNVLYVAPADEIAQAELRELEASRQSEALAPLVTEYIEVNYASAQTLLDILRGEGAVQGTGDTGGAARAGGILSPRGRAVVDTRTNTIIVQDTQAVIDDVRRLFARLDVPVRQVLIEARIVNASTSFSNALGVRWGGAQTFPGAGDSFLLGGSLESNIELFNNIAEYNSELASAVAGGQTLEQALAATVLNGPSFPQALAVDLGVTTAGASSIAIGYQGNKALLELELSALEASGNGEVIAQPKVTTQDQQNARIESGLQIPYQAQAGGTAGGSTTEFVTAALSLDVTPQITPDGRIIMLLDIHQDSVVPGSGAVPAIATNSVLTRVLVNDGETIVLGGVFREEVTTSVTKTPFLGDLPYLGNLFKRTENSETKTELLIFITPSIIKDML
jgi:type IV pilus assembly protein PilQ